MASILVTGGCGVVGSWACRQLSSEGHQVVALDLREDRTYLGPEIPVVTGDILEWPALISVFNERGIDTVVHLAALIAQCEKEPYRAVQTNVQGTLNVLEAARLKGCRRVVFTTSRAALGPIDGEWGAPTYTPIGEDYPYRRPITMYGITKLAAESVCLGYARRYGMDILGLRFPALYGPGRLARHGGYATLSLIIESAASGESLALEKGGQQLDDVLFIGDVAQAIVRAVSAPASHRPIYHISSGRLSCPTEFLAILRHRFPGCRVELGSEPSAGAAGYPSFCKFEDAAARRDLGFSPAYDLEGGIDAYLKAL